MTRFIPIAAAALLASCAVPGHEPALAEVDRQVEAHMSSRYDLNAVRAFLIQVVDQHPVFEGVSLASGRIGTEWRVERIAPGQRMRCGDWVIYDVEQGDEQFEIYFMFDEGGGRSVSVRARRQSRSHFEFIELALGEWVEIGKRKKAANQALQTTSVTRSGFGKVSVSDRQRRGV